jgi:peptidoglycan/LPS O-acetylase OafA/YrhL
LTPDRPATATETDAAPAASVDGLPADLPSLTSIRWFLALGVVLFHYQLNMLAPDAAGWGLIERARLAVDVFFILSGIVLAHVYSRQLQEGRYGHRRFLVARFARIYPAHIAMLVVMVLLAAAALAVGQQLDPFDYGLDGLFAAVLLIHAWFPISAGNEWNGPSWSLSAEWGAYLIFPAFAWAGLKCKNRPLVLIGLSLLLFAALNGLYTSLFGDVLVHAEGQMGVLRILPDFLLGVGFYHLAVRLRPSRRTAVLAAIASVAVLSVAMHMRGHDFLIVGVGALMVLALTLVSKVGADGPLAHPWMLASGEASYALYLVHMPLLVAWKNGRGLLTGVDSAYRLPVWEAGILLVVTILAAFALHYLWERPARRWIRARLLDRGPRPSPFPPQTPERFS